MSVKSAGQGEELPLVGANSHYRGNGAFEMLVGANLDFVEVPLDRYTLRFSPGDGRIVPGVYIQARNSTKYARVNFYTSNGNVFVHIESARGDQEIEIVHG